MGGFELGFDAARRTVILRVPAEFDDRELAGLQARMDVVVAEARRHGPLRFLCDNRAGRAFPKHSHDGFWGVLTADADPHDRIALLVANSLAKVRSRDHVGARGETFASEHAAFLWLGAGDTSVAA